MMKYKRQIATSLNEFLNNDIDFTEFLEIPSIQDMGDYALPCFKLSRIYKKNPVEIAKEIASFYENDSRFFSVEAKGAYVNFYLHKEEFICDVLSDIITKKETYGSNSLGKGKIVCIDYSSPNIAKPFHIGHLRSTVIGHALRHLYEHCGYKVYGINHLGDWGTQFGKLITAYLKWGNDEIIEQNGITALNYLYVRFHEEALKDPSLDDEARLWFVKMENNDPKAISIWKKFYDISMKEFQSIYAQLGIHFDAFTGESFYNDKMEKVIDVLNEKNLLRESQGAYIVDLEDKGMPPCLIKRSDNATLYATRDLACAMYRKEHYRFDLSLYVTALEQNLHFAQFFAVLEKAGFRWANELLHIPFGMVSLEEGKLSTRKGIVVLMQDIIDEATRRTLSIINEKNPSLKDKEKIAKDIAISAIIFNDLSNNRIKDIVFSWDRILNFDGETGPYLQYAHARACSILNKANTTVDTTIDCSLLCDPHSIFLVKTLCYYPQKIIDAMEKNEPSIVARHLIQIAHAFNKFYTENIILAEEEEVKKARLLLVYATKLVLKDGLSIICMKAPEKM